MGTGGQGSDNTTELPDPTTFTFNSCSSEPGQAVASTVPAPARRAKWHELSEPAAHRGCRGRGKDPHDHLNSLLQCYESELEPVPTEPWAPSWSSLLSLTAHAGSDIIIGLSR